MPKATRVMFVRPTSSQITTVTARDVSAITANFVHTPVGYRAIHTPRTTMTVWGQI